MWRAAASSSTASGWARATARGCAANSASSWARGEGAEVLVFDLRPNELPSFH